MRFSTLALAATAGFAAAQDSICDKYTKALLMDNTAKNQYTLVALLVKTAALGNFTGPGSVNPSLPGSKMNFTGFLAPGTVNGTAVNLAPYFSGALKSSNVNGMPASVNWLDGQSNATELVTMPMFIGATGSNQYTLLSHLVSYFGVLLGCTQYGMDGFPAYAGSNNQYSVHKYMDLSEAEFSWFNMNVGYSALSFGASQADATAAGMALVKNFGYRCAAAATVVPNTPANPQVICAGSGCPLAASPMAGCSGAAAVASFTPSEPATASMTGTASMTMTGSMSMTSSMMSATNAAESSSQAAAMSSAAAAGTSASAASGAAPRQTAAAGLLAGAAAVAAALL